MDPSRITTAKKRGKLLMNDLFRAINDGLTNKTKCFYQFSPFSSCHCHFHHFFFPISFSFGISSTEKRVFNLDDL